MQVNQRVQRQILRVFGNRKHRETMLTRHVKMEKNLKGNQGDS